MNQTILKNQLDSVYKRLEAADLFYGHGTDNAWDEAVQLVLSVADLPLHSGDEVLELALCDEAIQRIELITKKRIDDKMPLPYLLNRAWFVSQPFYVDENVLIPRSLMGYWLAEQFQPFVDPAKVKRILEVGTGSGCIAIIGAQMFEDADVVAGDISADALSVAKRNVEDYELDGRISLVESDCYDNIEGRFDLIVSNPPYVSHEDMQYIPDEYQHEPRMALEAPDEGLEIVLRLLKQAPQYLNEGGVLIVETGYSDATLQARMPDAPWIWLDTDADTSGLLLVTREQLQGYFHE